MPKQKKKKKKTKDEARGLQRAMVVRGGSNILQSGRVKEKAGGTHNDSGGGNSFAHV